MGYIVNIGNVIVYCDNNFCFLFGSFIYDRYVKFVIKVKMIRYKKINVLIVYGLKC